MLPVEPDCLDSHRSRAFYVTRDGISDVDDFLVGESGLFQCVQENFFPGFGKFRLLAGDDSSWVKAVFLDIGEHVVIITVCHKVHRQPDLF